MEEQVFGGAVTTKEARPLMRAMTRGMLGKCPHCGEGKLFRSFLKTVDRCSACGEDMHHHRADDLPAYLVVFVVGHIIIGGFMMVDAAWPLTLMQHLLIWAPLTIIMCLAMLQPVKGAVVGLQWALQMHGFGGHEEILDTHPEI